MDLIHGRDPHIGDAGAFAESHRVEKLFCVFPDTPMICRIQDNIIAGDCKAGLIQLPFQSICGPQILFAGFAPENIPAALVEFHAVKAQIFGNVQKLRLGKFAPAVG